MVEFVENLFEFNLVDRASGSEATWSSSGFNDTKKIRAKILDKHGITITEDSTFKIVGSPDASSKIILVGGDKDDWNELKKEDVKRWTELYQAEPDGILLATIGWVKIKKGIFKELQGGVKIVWGNNTNALETAQCLGVYLDVDAALAAFEKDNAKGRAEWIPVIEKKLSLSQDWNSKGVSFLKSKMKKMPDSNYLEMLHLAKGVKIFCDSWGKKIGTNWHIIHGRIDEYYKAEEKNQNLDAKSKANTADFILANAPAQEVIDAVGKEKAPLILYDKQAQYCYTDDGEKIKFYQISLKMAHGQLGKVTQAMKDRYKLSDSSEFYVSIVNDYLVNHGYELNEGVLSWAKEKLSQGLSALKSISIGWYEKISGFVSKLKNWAAGVVNSFNSSMPSGKPNKYQIQLMQKVLREDGRLGQGELLTESKLYEEKGITELLQTTNEDGAQKIVAECNIGIKKIEAALGTDDLMFYTDTGIVDAGKYKQKKLNDPKTNTWKYGDIIKIFANATAVDAFQKMIKGKVSSDLKKIVDEQITLAREIYFGKTKLPLFKVYGYSDSRKNTVEPLGTAATWVEKREKELTKGTLGTWPVIGFSSTVQKGMYYNIGAGLITGTDKTGVEPEYVNLAMRTNRADAYSFVVEGSNKLSLAQFQKKFGK
jgi:hypothetical protein